MNNNKSSKELVTKGMLKEVLDEAVDTIMIGMNRLFGRFKNEMNGKFGEVKIKFEEFDKRFNKVDRKLEKIEAEVTYIKRGVNDLKADLSDTPSRTEFNNLKQEVKILQAN